MSDHIQPLPDLRAGRLSQGDYARNFGDAQAPLTAAQAHIEAERCYYCFDAPCVTACPTGIDIPSFIQRIAQDNLRGAARTILEANPLGGLCARVCPTEVLCEAKCVRQAYEGKPVQIGLLQRHATDALMASPGAALFSRAAATGKRVAVVGSGPAGLACAHGLARLGHDIVVFEQRPKPGGLNEYGLATYKTAGDFAQREIAWLLSIGGIELRCGQRLGYDYSLDHLLSEYDAVFLGLGLTGVQALGLAEPTQGVCNAVDFIAQLRQSDPAGVPVGRRVVVVGGGMTAVDAAVQAKLLGAEEVTLVYRKGPEQMPASQVEREWAQTRGVQLRFWAAPQQFLIQNGQLTGLRFVRTHLQDGQLRTATAGFDLAADMVLKAIGQSYLAESAGPGLQLEAGRLACDDYGRTSHARVWAGGDCRNGGVDLTVVAVEAGKRAALSMHQALEANHG